MKSLRWFLLSAVLALLTTLPACSGKQSKKTKVAFISNNAFEFWKYAERGCQDAAEELGDIEVEVKMPADGSVKEQKEFIQDLQAKGYKAFAVSPNNVQSQIAFYTELNDEVPVVLVDSDVDETAKPGREALKARRYYLGTNNVEAGMAAGELLKKAMPKGGGFMIFVGKLDVLNAVQRRKGVVIALAGGEDKCKDELKKLDAGKYPIKFGDYELLDTRTDNGSKDTCRERADDALSNVKGLKAMVGLWEYNPPMMLKAVENYEEGKLLGKMPLIGFDENTATLAGIRKGHVQGTIVQSPYKFGYDSVKLMAALVKGDKAAIEKYKPDDAGRIWVAHRTIDKDKVDDFEKELQTKKAK